jgi:predicted transcriptional regulator of viral defense system
MKRRLGNLERQLFAYAQLRNMKTFRTGDLCIPLGITAKQEREMLSRLSRARLIASVRRGLYLVPTRLPLGAQWTPHEALALNTLMDDREGAYQICGPNAFNRYGFDEQIPNRFYVYNNRISGERLIGSVALSLIKVSDARLGNTEVVKLADGSKLVYSSRTRTLVDAVYDWSRFGSLPRGYEWIRRELSAGRIEANDLARSALRYGNQGTVRRLGVLLEDIGVEERLLARLERNLRSSKSLILWIPNAGGRGRVSRRWGVIRNGHG